MSHSLGLGPLGCQEMLGARSLWLLRRTLPGVRLLATAKRANEQALALPELRLVCDQGKQLGVMTPAKALEIAKERQLQLVEVKATATPTVWRLFASLEDESMEPRSQAPDGPKGSWKKSKKKKERKLKEVRMNDKLESRDLEVKLKLVKSFLAKDKVVKLVAVNTGRKDGSISRAEALLLHIVEQCGEEAICSGISGRRDTTGDGRTILGVVATTLTPKDDPK
uniref:Translation initiation factor 3 N-terminal domain-containing protein n=2 Tax=Haptolina ericina TaxID=156174 RepID=A0A7S3B859_9EUKA